jgi:hypothetical protein
MPLSPRSRILILSSSILTDRMLLYTEALDTVSRDTAVTVWAKSFANAEGRAVWNQSQATVEAFPEVSAYREIPYNYLRRLNEFTWDFRLSAPSRLSMQRHVRNKNQRLSIRSLKAPARALAWLRAERVLERFTERCLLSYPRSPEAEQRLKTLRPDVLVTTGPFLFWEPAVVAAARNLHIPILAMIPSWDNLSTKARMVFRYDGYMVWSAEARRQLHHYYPESRGVPVYTVGTPQFDIFFQKRVYRSREQFCAAHGLRPDRPIVLYAVASPNFLKERHGAVEMARRVGCGELGDVQLLVRPHPAHDKGDMVGLFTGFGPQVVLQQTAQAQHSQNEEQIIEWVNTFRHADVVINLSSTVTVDAALFDRPIVNLDYDPEPGRPNQELVEDVNHLWTHFKPVAESGGVWMVRTPDEMVHAVKTYLAHPEMHREKRRWIVEFVCGYVDGQCGKRLGSAMLDFARLGNGQLSRAAGAGTGMAVGISAGREQERSAAGGTGS